jgi:hypothetical protein
MLWPPGQILAGHANFRLNRQLMRLTGSAEGIHRLNTIMTKPTDYLYLASDTLTRSHK